MIGIYGGTFDPVHFGHLRPAIDVYSELGLSEVRFIPAGVPAHRDLPVASSKQRHEMLLLATDNVTGLNVDAREIRRDGPSYTVDTIKSLQVDFPNEKFCLIVGMDAFIDFESWREWQTILQLVNVVVTDRPNVDLDSMKGSGLKNYLIGAETKDKLEFLASAAGRCYFCAVTQLDISATQIRDRVKNTNELTFLLPDSVVDYLLHAQLYR